LDRIPDEEKLLDLFSLSKQIYCVNPWFNIDLQAKLQGELIPFQDQPQTQHHHLHLPPRVSFELESCDEIHRLEVEDLRLAEVEDWMLLVEPAL